MTIDEAIKRLKRAKKMIGSGDIQVGVSVPGPQGFSSLECNVAFPPLIHSELGITFLPIVTFPPI